LLKCLTESSIAASEILEILPPIKTKGMLGIFIL